MDDNNIASNLFNKKSTIQLQESNLQREFVQPLLGHNGVDGEYWRDQNFLNKLAAFKGQFIRIPGGTISNYWNWHEGRFVDSQIPVEWIASKQPNRTTINQYAKAIQHASLMPIFVLNLLTSNLEEQINTLKRFQQFGLDVKYVELGNELYQELEDHLRRFPTVDDYIDEVQRYVKALRQQFPGVKIGVIGNARERNYSRGRTWNEALVRRNFGGADAVTMHVYGFNGTMITDHLRGVNKKDQVKFSNDHQALNTILDKPELVTQIWLNYISKIIGLNKSIWVTEYGILWRDRLDNMSGTWIHGLQNTMQAFELMFVPNIKIMTQHAIIGNNNFGYMFSSKNAFLAKNKTNRETEPFDLTAKGHQSELLHDFLTNAQQIERYDVFFDKRKGSSGPLRIFAAKSIKKHRKNLLFMNFSDKSVVLNVPSFFQAGNGKTISSQPFQRIINADDIDIKKFKTKNQLAVVPYSITLLIAKKADYDEDIISR